MAQYLIISVVLVLLAMAFLAARVLLKKNGRFRSMHISDSKAMRERGIHCVMSQDREARRAAATKLDISKL